MRRDIHSKAIIFPPNPDKQILKDQRKRVEHHSDEIKFLADCINYQQDIITKQDKIIKNLSK